MVSKQQETEAQRIEDAIAEQFVAILSAAPSAALVSRIAYEANLYRIKNRLPAQAQRAADRKVATLIKKLREALSQSEKHHSTLSIALGESGQQKLAGIEQLALELGKGPGRKRATFGHLRELCDVVLDAFWIVEPSKIGKTGISTRDGDQRVGPVLDIMRSVLDVVGVTRQPSDELLFKTVSAVVKSKICLRDSNTP